MIGTVKTDHLTVLAVGGMIRAPPVHAAGASRERDPLFFAAEFGTDQVFWSILWFALVAILIALCLYVVADIVRSNELSGLAKAIWVAVIVFVPFPGSVRLPHGPRRQIWGPSATGPTASSPDPWRPNRPDYTGPAHEMTIGEVRQAATESPWTTSP